MINRLPWRKKLRTSAANNLDKINEIIDYINTSNISPVTLSDSASGRSVVAGCASSLKSLEIYGESVQDGTPTPDAPVEVQVVKSGNLLGQLQPGTYNAAGITAVVESNNIVKLSGTATGGGSLIIPLVQVVPIVHDGAQVYAHNRNSAINSSLGFTVQPGTAAYNGPTMGAFSPVNRIAALNMSNWNSIDTIGSLRIYISPTLNIDGVLTCQPSIERTDQQTPFITYDCIDLLIGDDVTPINLQGNVLASLSDGTRDRLLVDSAGHKTIDNAVGHIASYNGESVGDVWLSSTGQLTTGADIYYKLATPQTIDLGYITPPTITEGDVISVSAEVVPVIDVAWWMYEDITAIIDDLKAYVDYKTGSNSNALGSNRVSTPISLTDKIEQTTNNDDNEEVI